MAAPFYLAQAPCLCNVYWEIFINDEQENPKWWIM